MSGEVVTSIKLPEIGNLTGQEIDLAYPVIKYGRRGKKLVLITDTITREDKESGHLFAGSMGGMVKNAFDLAIKYGKNKPSQVSILSTQVSYGKTSLSQANDDTHKVIERIIKYLNKEKPDVVVIMGFTHLEAWLENSNIKHTKKTIKNLRGRLIRAKLGPWKGKVSFTFSPRVFASQDPKDYASGVNLIGFVTRDFEQAINGRNFYQIPEPDKTKWHNVLTIEAFDIFYKKLLKQKIVSIDTEGANLNRIYGNTLFTMLFSWDGETVYQVPFLHPQTPFLPKEIEYIREKMRHYFENFEATYHIYQNAKYDLFMWFSQLGIEYYASPIYDTMVGTMSLDENRKFFTKQGMSAYGLEHISAQYGSLSYLTSAIAKEDRGNMAKYSLDQILDYGASDVVNPYHVVKFQIAEAKRRGSDYENFLKAVTRIGSDKILSFVEMERHGLPVDKDYLVSQMAPDSELNKEKAKQLDAFKNSKAVQNVNAKLCEEKGIPTKGRGLFEKHARNAVWLFKINKEEHVQKLMFDELKLEPLTIKKNGGGKTDKAFLQEYKHIPEVESLSELRKVGVLINTYINGIFKILVHNPDSKDIRVRASYDFIRIITGRTGASSPSLQNIPQHGRLAKLIKRMFSAKKWNMMLKQDQSAHEIRVWGLLARDHTMRETFAIGMQLRREFRIMMQKNVKLDYELYDFLQDNDWFAKTTTADMKRAIAARQDNNPDLKKALELLNDIESKGDLHRINCVRFGFGDKPENVTGEARQISKAVTFGAIYCKMAFNMALELWKEQIKPFYAKFREKTKGMEEGSDQWWTEKRKFGEDIQQYVTQAENAIASLFQSYPRGAQWIEARYEQFAQTNRVLSIFGSVRHLWGNLHSEKSVVNKSRRRAVNSPVQGVASDMVQTGSRAFRKMNWFSKKAGVDLKAAQCNAVHDSSEVESHILAIPMVLYYMEHSYTTQVHNIVRDVYQFKMIMGLETDTEIGAALSRTKKFDFTEARLLNILKEEIEWQNETYSWDIPVDETIKKVRHNWRVVQSFRVQELEKMQTKKGGSPSRLQLITPENIATLGLQL